MSQWYKLLLVMIVMSGVIGVGKVSAGCTGVVWCDYFPCTGGGGYTVPCGGASCVASCRSGTGDCAKGTTCALTCNITWWSAWSTCTKPCGGGTQYRNSNCGTIQSRACNTQSCCTSTAPGTPVLVSPDDNAELMSTTVDLDWAAVSSWGNGCPSNTNQYKLYVEANDSTPDVLVDTLASTTTISSFTGAVGNRYYWKVVATNGSVERASLIRSFYMPANVTGTVYYDQDNVCSTSVPENVGGGLSAELRDTIYSDVVGVGGAYSVVAPVGTYNYLDLGGIPVGYSCSSGCLQGCPTATSVVSPSVGNNFFLTNNKDAWWQVVGAGVYAGSTAGGVTIGSDLPYSTSRLVIPGTNDLAAVVRASGSVSVGAGEISEENWSVNSSYRGKTMDYRYFASRMGVTPGTESDFSSGTIEEVEIAGLGQDFYYAEDTVDGEVSLGDVWTVTSGESYVIFVDGDLEINQDVTVESGGFLIFIVNGEVTVTTNVVSMQGMYVMDDVFVTETLNPTDDSQLSIEGMVVAWGGVSLGRDLGAVGNGISSAEQFVYRSDLLINMPAKLKSFALNWQEVVPGTFD